MSRRGPELLASGGDDYSARIWDVREKDCINVIKHDYQGNDKEIKYLKIITAVQLSPSSTHLFTGSTTIPYIATIFEHLKSYTP